jgi:hypothetical protein
MVRSAATPRVSNHEAVPGRRSEFSRAQPVLLAAAACCAILF